MIYEHLLSNQSSSEYVDIVQKIVKIANVNAKGENPKILLYLVCKNNHDGVISILRMVLLYTSFLFYRS
jgi:hypothetical protein